jgi:3-oxoadipate enol-lactonase
VTDVELNYEISGDEDAPALLMGGSLGTTLQMWHLQVPKLSEQHRVIRFDHRGHGGSPVVPGPYSMADLGGDVVALMDRLELESTAYCGLSLGGMVGQWLAINAPDRIERLVLISTAAYLPPADSWRERAATVRQAGTPGAIADAVLTRWFTPDYFEANPIAIKRFREMLSSVSAEGYAGCCEAIADMDLREGLSDITAPTGVIVGIQDPATPPSYAREIADNVPDARLKELEPGAHLLNIERAADVTKLIAHFTEA